MNIKCPFSWSLIVLVAVILPGISLAVEKHSSNNPPKENKSLPDASDHKADGLKASAAKNSNTAGTGKNDVSKTTKGEKLSGRVVYVTDGDTLVLQVDKRQYIIRLSEIDAPEIEQPFGNQSKKALSDKIFEKRVQVTTHGKDTYENTLGIIEIDGNNVNLEMVKEGFAWHYKEYSTSKTLANAEDEAKKTKIGLWADENPIPPWQWRRESNDKNPEDKIGIRANDPSTDKNVKPQTDQTQTYWLTTSSNTRHNSKCRYYQKTKGRVCSPDEGKACKICGG